MFTYSETAWYAVKRSEKQSISNKYSKLQKRESVKKFDKNKKFHAFPAPRGRLWETGAPSC